MLLWDMKFGRHHINAIYHQWVFYNHYDVNLYGEAFFTCKSILLYHIN
jgi:hypothetical protein